MEEVVLETQSVGFVYASGMEALAGIDVSVRAGEVVCIVGPSGCGKSTLLAILAGLAVPTRGKVHWHDDMGGREVRPVGALAQRRLTMVFQKDTILPWLTVEKNVGLGLRYLPGLSAEEKHARVATLIERAGLGGSERLYPRQLSGGMRRRVALLAGVAPRPRVLVLDEPFAGVDEPTRVSIHRDLLALCYSQGQTMIFVTHDLSEAITLADTVYLLSRRPAHVALKESLPFGHDRDVAAVRESEEYAVVYRRLWSRLRDEIT